MTGIQWRNCWDALRETLNQKTVWSRPLLLDLMNEIERREIRKAEDEHNQNVDRT